MTVKKLRHQALLIFIVEYDEKGICEKELETLEEVSPNVIEKEANNKTTVENTTTESESELLDKIAHVPWVNPLSPKEHSTDFRDLEWDYKRVLYAGP